MLKQGNLRSGCRGAIEAIEDGVVGAAGTDAVNGSKTRGSAIWRHAVEVPVGRLHDARLGLPSIGSVGEIVQHGDLAAGGEFEDHTIVVGTAGRRGPIKVAVGALNDSDRLRAVSAV